MGHKTGILMKRALNFSGFPLFLADGSLHITSAGTSNCSPTLSIPAISGYSYLSSFANWICRFKLIESKLFSIVNLNLCLSRLYLFLRFCKIFHLSAELVPKQFGAILLFLKGELCSESLHMTFTTLNRFGIRLFAFLTWIKLGFFKPLDILDRIFADDCQTANILKEFICWPWCIQEGKANTAVIC